MHATQLREALAADPFHPFRLRFGPGRTVPITNPGLVVVSDTRRTAVALKPGTDGFEIIDVILVESVEFDDEFPTDGPTDRSAA